MNRISALDVLRRGTVFIILLSMGLFFALTSDRFLRPDNLVNVASQNVHIAIVAVGVALTMLLGGIDLSVGSVAAFTGAITAGLVVRSGVPFPLAVMIGLLVGFSLGAVNGALVIYGKLPPFVATLAMLGVARGLTLVYTEGRPISGLGDAFTAWGDDGRMLLVALLVALLAWLMLTRTRFGVHIYAIGGSEETARLAGVPVNRVKILVYSLSGLLAALAGILLTARLFSAQPQAAVGLELSAIAAAVLGGVSLFGGVGTIPGVIAGALIVGVLNNGMNLLRVPSYPKQIIQGVVLVAAVLIDITVNRSMQGSASRRAGS